MFTTIELKALYREFLDNLNIEEIDTRKKSLCID